MKLLRAFNGQTTTWFTSMRVSCARVPVFIPSGSCIDRSSVSVMMQNSVARSLDCLKHSILYLETCSTRLCVLKKTFNEENNIMDVASHKMIMSKI